MANTPDFKWAAIYYPEWLLALKQVKAQLWPEHTENDDHDPVNQLLGLQALVAHLLSCRLDHTAREMYPATARLRQSFFGPAQLLGYEFSPPIPAEADMLADISGALSGSTLLVRAHSLFSTQGTIATPPIVYEYLPDADLYGGPTGAASWSMVQDDGGVLTSYTSGSLWGGTPVVGDKLYLGHSTLMWNKTKFTLSAASTGVTAMRWEYYDDLRSGVPDSVAINGASLDVRVQTVVGATNATGLPVKVTCLLTGQSETKNVTYVGGNKIATTGYLGQTSPSTNGADYLVETDWPELPGLADGTTRMSATGDVTWTLPQDSNRRWAKTAINSSTQYWIRARVTAVNTPSAPNISSLSEPSRTAWTLKWTVTQGQRVEDTLGTTDTGSGGQAFTLNNSPMIKLLALTVDGTPWGQVDNLLSAASYELVFSLKEQPDTSWQVKFGDGSNGAIPGSVVAVVATYRYGGEQNGNVGSGEIQLDRSGNGRLVNIRNPRDASGWVVQEGTTDASLEETRVNIPKSIRTLERAVTPTDCETLAVNYRQTDGSQIVTRALAVEEGSGLKTVNLLSVGYGDVAPTTEEMTELNTYFNGTVVGVQRVGGVVLGNTQVAVQAFVPHSVNVTATVDVLSDYSSTAQAAIEAGVKAFLQPTAKRVKLNADGTKTTTTIYQWSWGGRITSSAINTAITMATIGVVDVTLSGWSDITLGTGELPVPGTISISVVSVTG